MVIRSCNNMITCLIVLICWLTISTHIDVAMAFNDDLDIQGLSDLQSDDYSFFFIGHAYGRPQKTPIKSPPASILNNLDELKKHDFGIFGGDAFKNCNQENITAFFEQILAPLSMPIFDATGNHDACISRLIEFDNIVHFQIGPSAFLIQNFTGPEFNPEAIDEWAENLNIYVKKANIRNIFVFTHRPFFLQSQPDTPRINCILALVNPPELVLENKYLEEKIAALTEELASRNKRFFWFSGDVGVRREFPLLFQQADERVTFIASGIAENEFDHAISVKIEGEKVMISVLSFSGFQFGEISAYDETWLLGR